jgi:ribosomal protein S18 acetylase RimI-like enzyme
MTETGTVEVMEVEESNRQFIDAWKLYARRAANGAVEELPGLVVAFSRVAMPLMNVVFLSSPVVDTADFAARVRAAVKYGHRSGVSWILGVCEEWLPASMRAEAAQILAEASLQPESLLTGMVTDTIAPPRRALPPVDIRRVDSKEARIAAADLNSVAYAMPLQWGREAFDREAIFPADVFGFVGYVDGAAVSTATTAILDGKIYVTLVATAAEQQHKGYAEAVTRHALEQATAESGITRTVLHATEAGRPLYQALGYRAVANFTLYGQGSGGG